MSKTDAIAILKDALVMPYRGTMDAFQGGVFTSDGAFLQESIVYRGSEPPLEAPTRTLQGTYIWGGCVFVHFGHFIWETLSRLYALRQYSEKYPLLCISPTCKLEYVRLLLRTLGIHNEIHLVDAPVRVQSLLFAPPGSSIVPLHMTAAQIGALACFEGCARSTQARLWLSRTSLQSWQHKDAGESWIEGELAKDGFTIVHPEEMPLRQQVSLLSSASILAGFDGSAWFSLFFARQIACRAVVFNRFRKIVDTVPYLFKVRHIPCELHEFPVVCDEAQKGDRDWHLGLRHLEPERIVATLRQT